MSIFPEVKKSDKLWNLKSISKFLNSNDTWLFFCKLSTSTPVNFEEDVKLTKNNKSSNYQMSKFVFMILISHYNYFCNKLNHRELMKSFVCHKSDEAEKFLIKNKVLNQDESLDKFKFTFIVECIFDNIFLKKNLDLWNQFKQEVKHTRISEEKDKMNEIFKPQIPKTINKKIKI